MSCQSSRQSTLEDGLAGLADALTNVPEESCYAFTDASDREGFDDAVRATAGEWLCASIAFTGDVEGCVTLTLPSALSRELYTSFVGADPADNIEAWIVGDFAGEFASMVCGQWLTQSQRTATFDLAPPRVTRHAEPPARVPDSGETYLFINQSPVRLGLGWTPRRGTRGDGPGRVRGVEARDQRGAVTGR